MALGREGKQQLHFEPAAKPHTAAMAAKLQTDEGKQAARFHRTGQTADYASNFPLFTSAQSSLQRLAASTVPSKYDSGMRS